MPVSCHYHPTREAVFTCSQCRQPICQNCVHNSTPPVWCKVCVDAYYGSQQKTEGRKAKKTLLIIGISFIVGVLLIPSSNDLGTVLLKGYMCSGIYPAWTLLPKIPKFNPDFQFLGLLVFILYPITITITLVWLLFLLSLKLVVSMFLGIFIVPIKVYQSIKALTQ